MISYKASIIDLGLGNVGSLRAALKFCGINSELVTMPEKTSSDLVILPGVGSYPAAMKIIKERNLDEYINEITNTKLFLGICLGMQLLGTNSSEGGAISEGLDLIQFEVRSLKKIGWINDKLPNIGFHKTELWDKDLFKGFNNSYPFYYVHSYCADLDTINKENIAAVFSDGASNFVSGVRKQYYWTTISPRKKS